MKYYICIQQFKNFILPRYTKQMENLDENMQIDEYIYSQRFNKIYIFNVVLYI